MTKTPKRKPVVNCSICVACGECAETCPRFAIHIKSGAYSEVDYQKCIGCGFCAAVCPASAISMETA